jgi:predicted nucleotidyltransferase
MKITGIVSEYNPFHKGHEYQLKKARELSGCDAVVCVMSGNFVQRGEPAIIDKFRRAEAAVWGGADIVIELPLPFSCQNAEMFAYGAIRELGKIPVHALSFGCENDNVDTLRRIAEAQLESIQYNNVLRDEIKKGISYPAAMTKALSSIMGSEFSDSVVSPNNVLAVEYIKSSMKQNVYLEFFPVKRIGKSHNDHELSGLFDSATAIRSGILSGSAKQTLSVTSKSMESINGFYSDYGSFNMLDNYMDIINFRIMELEKEGLNDIFDVSEGLNNKIYQSLFMHRSSHELIMSLKSKRYTYSRLRRILLNIALDITYKDIKKFMSTEQYKYIKVLAFNDTGRKVIKNAQSRGTAVICRYSDYKKFGISAEELPSFKLTAKATNLYYLPFENREANLEYKKNAAYIAK